MIFGGFYKFAEFTVLFFILPILFFYEFIPLKMIVPILWVVSFYVFFVLKYIKKEIIFDAIKSKDLRYVLFRFAIISMLLLLYTFYFHYERLFVFILDKPYVYLLIMVLYPLLSVIPQEIIYRRFFTLRYKKHFSMGIFMFLNALVFSFAHIIFVNYIAIVFTFIGAYFFISTYLKTKSFSLVCVEHALYGNLLFTIGLGDYFYHQGNI